MPDETITRELEFETCTEYDDNPDLSYLEQSYSDLEAVKACPECGGEELARADGPPAPLEHADGCSRPAELETVAEKYRRQDAARLAAYRADEWHMLGVFARATITLERAGYVDRRITLNSPGLWGVESDSDRDYFEEIAREGAAELRPELETLGFTAEEIDAAIAAAWPAAKQATA